MFNNDGHKALLDNGYTMNIPYEVRQLVTIIESYNLILVGWYVRDSLMGIEPKDFDMVDYFS